MNRETNATDRSQQDDSYIDNREANPIPCTTIPGMNTNHGASEFGPHNNDHADKVRKIGTDPPGSNSVAMHFLVQPNCPRGHTMKIVTSGRGTCDVCHCSFTIGQEILLCRACHGYAVCDGCKTKSDMPNSYAISLQHYDSGVELWQRGSYGGAADQFQKCVDVCEASKLKHWDIPCGLDDLSLLNLARAQFVTGETDAAIETCAAAISCFKSHGSNRKEVAAAMEVLADMKQVQKEARPVPASASAELPSLGPLGVSIHHLQTTFMAEVRVAALDKDSNIHEIENLQGLPGVIRRRGAKAICPVDGKMGAAYVHTLSGVDRVGEATHMLSYCWSYSIGDIVDALREYCSTNDLDTRRTYVWIDCLCINQHRVVEQKENGGTGMLNFEHEFPKKLKKIGHMLAMMAPWQAPTYLTRLWCIFELYAAHANGCNVDIIMPPHEKGSLEQNVIEEEGGINALYEALGNTRVQNAKASVEGDKQVILGMIESTVGCEKLNNEVNKLLRGWMNNALVQLVETRDITSDESYALFCLRVGNIFRENGEHDAALEQYQRCLVIQMSVLGKGHPKTAITHNNIGLVLSNLGDYDYALEQHNMALSIQEAFLGSEHHHQDIATTHNNIGYIFESNGNYDGALEEYKRCLAIRESVLGKEHPDTAETYNNIGTVLDAKCDFDGALKQYHKCRAIEEAVLGRTHPSTATTYNNIGSVLVKKGEYHAALKWFQSSLVILRSTLGQDHPDTKICQENVNYWKEIQIEKKVEEHKLE